LLVGLQYGFKDWVGKDVLAVVQVVVGGEYDMDISFSILLYDIRH